MKKDETDKFRSKARQAQRSKALLECKLATPELTDPTCAVLGCTQPARKATSEGLGHMCHQHILHQRRHGSVYRASFGRELAPYRYAAIIWLEQNVDHVLVTGAIEEVRHLMRYAGRLRTAEEVRYSSAATKAKAVWARCRDREVSPLVVIAAELGVAAAMRTELDMPTGRAGVEYKRVQAGKVLMRTAGGVTFKDALSAERKASYAYSSGRVLRHLGQQLERVGELLEAHHLQDILDLMQSLKAAGAKTMTERPFPARYSNTKRNTKGDCDTPSEATTFKPVPRWTREVQVENGQGHATTLRIETN